MSVAAVALGAIYALREAYEVRPAFAALGLDYDVENDGRTSIELQSKGETKFSLVAINGRRVGPDLRIGELALRLNEARGPVVRLDLRASDGKLFTLEQKRASMPVNQAAAHARDLRVGARLASGLLACSTLLLCALLLAWRRLNDPVALLFAFAFAGLAATIDPPLAMWMAFGWPLPYDIISSAWFYLLLVALALFPDGTFVPKTYRWVLVCGLPLAIFISLHNIDTNVQAVFAFAALFAVLLGQVRRYRRTGPGIERQQIKWAAFGFASGLVLVAFAVALLPFVSQDPNKPDLLLRMVIMLLFSLGMAVLPLGLLVALVRFRLWEADTVISRSAAYAVVTLVVGVVWAASSDLVKLVIETVMGRESQAGATTVGAIIAAGIFAPTQNAVLGWTRKHFGGPRDQIHGAAARMKSWALTQTPEEVARRALSIVDGLIHPVASAILIDGPLASNLVAARNASSADDPYLVERLAIRDDESRVGELLFGRRSDGNRYNRDEMDALHLLVPALAEALRVARSHHSRESELQQRLDEMAARLAQLEGGAAKPA